MLYHFSDMDRELSVELSYDELKAAFASFGFRLVKEQTGTALLCHAMILSSYEALIVCCRHALYVHSESWSNVNPAVSLRFLRLHQG